MLSESSDEGTSSNDKSGAMGAGRDPNEDMQIQTQELTRLRDDLTRVK